MSKMIAQRFNWKWNRIKVSPFYTISWQQDYPQYPLANLGWLEHAYGIDINNTALPKPIFPIECVRDLEATSSVYSAPTKICFLPNNQLNLATQWAGPLVKYTNPLGATVNPNNPPTAFIDVNGNYLILTAYGTTGLVTPFATTNAAPGTQVSDGTCQWTVVDPFGSGFRIDPLPSQTGTVYQINVIAQAKAPSFANLQQKLDPIPDDFASYFNDGFIALLHRHSSNPAVRAKEPQKQMDWLKAMAEARGQADREKDNAGFIPDRSIMSEPSAIPVGPAWPFGPYGVG
ncbi:MAG TPA: hypothetical protein VMT22_03075 [Terriglobales bacterium]|nr:hypothetical protein [Terriglobales bacterium]